MASKLVTDRERSTLVICSFLGANAARVEAALRQRVPDVPIVVLLQGLAMWLLTTVRELVAADQANEAELADDAVPRDRRDRAWAALRESVIGFRTVIAANHGDVALKQLGLWDPCPPDVSGTLAYGRALVSALAGPPTLGPARHSAAVTDLALARTELEALCAPLELALADVVANEVRNAAALGVKNRAMTEHDRVRRAVLDTACGLFDAASLPELSEELRATVRRDSPSAEDTEPAPVSPTPVSPAPAQS